MMLGIPWYAVVAGCALVADVVTLVLRKHEGHADYGLQPPPASS